MASIIDNIKAAAEQITHGAFKLKDPNNVDSEISRGDLLDPEPQTSFGRSDELIAQGNRWFEESRQAFWEHHEQFFTGIAMYCNKSYQSWDNTAQSMVPPGGMNSNPDEMERMLRIKTNIIRPKVELAQARISAMWPDAYVAPKRDDDISKRKAQVANAVTAHASRAINLVQLIEDAQLAAMISTNSYVELCWDNHKEAIVGVPQADGSIKYQRLPIGEISASVLLSIDAYPDPASSMTGCIHDGAYFIKKSIRQVSWIKQKWGVTVEATCNSQNYGFLRQRLEWIAGDRGMSRSTSKDSAEIMEVWNKPSPQYPQGRFWVQTSDKLVWAGWWPYKCKSKYPFVKIGYKKNIGSVWDLNFVSDLVDQQVQLNGLDSYLYARQMWDRPTEYIDDMSEVAPPDLLSKSLGRTVGWSSRNSAHLPEYKEPPAPGAFYFERRKDILSSVDMISGVRDLNALQEGQTQPMSGAQYDLMMQEDRSRLGPVTRQLARSVVEIYEWFLELYAQYGASLPRMLDLDDKGISLNGGIAAVLTDLQALKDGDCCVLLNAGSGEGKLPAAQEEWLKEFVALMAKGVPPPVLKFWLQQTQWIRTDHAVDTLLAEYEIFFEKQQAQAAQLQQMKGNQAQSMIELKAEQAKQEAAIETNTKQVEAAISVHTAEQEQRARAMADQMTEEHRSTKAKEIEDIKFAHSMALQNSRMSQPNVSYSVSLPGQLGPAGVQSAQEKLGLEPDSTAVLTKIITPPNPKNGVPRKKN